MCHCPTSVLIVPLNCDGRIKCGDQAKVKGRSTTQLQVAQQLLIALSDAEVETEEYYLKNGMNG